jgi:NAD(P)H-flavin reductase
MLAKKYKSEVVSIENPFEGIYTVEFKSLGRKYKYQPGQFLHLAIDKDYDGVGQWPESRCFSMQSTPNDSLITITYAVIGEFTKLMEEQLNPGSEVWLKLPYGDLFQQPHNKTNAVFIAGGTGITPFLSLFKHESFMEYSNPKIYLGFKSKEYNIYQKELAQIPNKSKIVKVFYQDEVGVIDIDSIYKENGDLSSYFISGPPQMIKNFKLFLLEKGVDSNNILTDDWE